MFVIFFIRTKIAFAVSQLTYTLPPSVTDMLVDSMFHIIVSCEICFK